MFLSGIGFFYNTRQVPAHFARERINYVIDDMILL